MQITERSQSESLPEILDQALVQLQSGASVEECLSAYPQHAAALEPLLRASDLLHAQASAPLPAEMDGWLATGALDFAAIAAQMAPKYAKPQTPHQRVRAATQAQHQFDDTLDFTLARARQGEPLATVLADHPAQAAALEPLLGLGARIQAEASMPLPAEMLAWLPTGRHEFMALAEQMAPRYARQRRRAAARKLTAQRAAAAVVVVAITMGAVDSVSAQSLPGDTLYTWKRTKEDISLALIADPGQRSQMLLEYANRRLDEFNTLVQKQPEEVSSSLISETLNSLLSSAQQALTSNPQTNVTDVRPELRTLLDKTKLAVQQAAPLLPASQPELSQVAVRADQLVSEIPNAPTTMAEQPTSSPEPNTSTSTSGSSGGGNKPQPSSAPTAGSPALNATATPVPTSPAAATGQPSPIGATSVPIGATSAPAASATPDPATALPPTLPPSPVPTDAPPGSTSVPSSVPTSEPSVEPIPTATAVPVTEVPSEPPPPTVPPTSRATRTPPTITPTDTPTDVPTDTPTDVPTEVPTDTPTDVPTDTPTDVPTEVPTDTLTPLPTPAATAPSTADGTSTPTNPPAGPQIDTSTPAANPNPTEAATPGLDSSPAANPEPPAS